MQYVVIFMHEGKPFVHGSFDSEPAAITWGSNCTEYGPAEYWVAIINRVKD